LQAKIKNIQKSYNIYQITTEEAKVQLDEIIEIINNRAIEIACKFDKMPHIIKASHFINV
jgi:hypothetical protein